MTTTPVPDGLLGRAGLPAAEAAAWAAAVPNPQGPLDAAAAALSQFLAAGQALSGRLPGRAHRSADEQAARDMFTTAMDGARDSFLRVHADALYDVLTGGYRRSPRLAELLAAAAARVPGLVPAPADLAAEQARPLAEKEGIEFAQGLLAGHLLARPRAGRHLIGAMLRPMPEASDRLGEFRSAGTLDLGPVQVTRRGRAGVLELRNPRHLNAEDDITLGPTECAVDLILLDPDIDIGVIRGGVVDHPRYPGVRVFGSGLNLTRLYHGQLDFLFYLVRDLGYVHKIYRGIVPPGPDAGPGLELGGPDPEPIAPGTGLTGLPGSNPEGTMEKLWIAAVERFAVGGACQLLHVVDHVIATRGSRFFLPARNEGIIPGASNLRLPRFVGDRAARQAILSGRQWVAGEPDAALLCDEVVQPDGMDQAVDQRIAALTSSGLVNAAANRCTLRAGQEPLDLFREYMAAFSVEQARCHLSPALVRNLEVHWNAPARRV